MTVAMAVASQESKRAVDLFSSNHAVLSSIHDFTGLPQHTGERLGLVLSYLVSPVCCMQPPPSQSIHPPFPLLRTLETTGWGQPVDTASLWLRHIADEVKWGSTQREDLYHSLFRFDVILVTGLLNICILCREAILLHFAQHPRSSAFSILLK